MKTYSLGFILIVVLLFSNLFYPQTFTTTPFITMPGDNTDIDVLTNFNYVYSPTESFVCWVNKFDSVYSIYLRQTTTASSTENILIYSDTNQIANPKIAFVYNSSDSAVRIVWQSFINNHWQILSRIYAADTLTNIIGITDSLTDHITPALSGKIVFWAQNGNLVYHDLDSTGTGNYILDSAGCSNPSILNFSYSNPKLVYEKGPTGSKQIMEAEKFEYSLGSQWVIRQISNGGNNKNPRMNFMNIQPSYEKFENGVWKAVYETFRYDTTNNISYNCENPITYIFPLLINKKSNVPTPFFVVYDSDSLNNNKEIILNTAPYSDTTMNLSNAEGNDYLPYISFFGLSDTPYVAIYWIHDQNGKKDIWMAYSKYNPISGLGPGPGIKINYFVLNQNYPNPFNPSTLISWHLAKSNLVTLKIYDILGNEITTLVNEYKSIGEHSITFNVQQIKNRILSTGIYFYQLKAGSYISTKKMLYLK